jgi:DNA end-binding protein Ku
MAARSMWSGSISFGLVNIPVKLYVAVREERVAFHMLHDQDKVRLQRKMVCPADGKEVHAEHTVKGFEIGPDQYVVVSQEELDAVAPEKSRTINIQDFVSLDDIDPVYYDRAYYLAPGEHAAKAYRLLVDAMTKAKKVGVAKFVMRNKEYLAALRPVEGSLFLSTMHFGDEVVDASTIPGLPVHVKVDEREVKMAMQLIESLDTKFDPHAYRDEYKDRVMELVKRKAEGEEVVTQPEVPKKSGRVVDLMSALEASLAAARTASHKGESRRTHTRRRKSA